MKKSILYVGVDVDDKVFHVAALSLETGEIFEFKLKPTLGALLKKLKKLQEKGFESREKTLAWSTLTHNLWLLARLPYYEEKLPLSA